MDALNNRKLEKWKIANLKEHPKQAALFRSKSPQEVKELADDMRRNGQTQPAEVLPDGTLLAGKGRSLAAQLLGWGELTVWVRHDLAGDPAAAERRLIEANLGRRQMGPLEIARCYRHLKSLGKRSYGNRLDQREREELRDQIGKRLGLSGRTLDRYLRILDETPRRCRTRWRPAAWP